MKAIKYSIITSMVVIASAIISYLLLALPMKMIADDYCIAVRLNEMGTLGTLQWYYTNWSAHFTFPFIKALTYYGLGYFAHPVMPIFTYLLWWAGNICLLWLIFRKWGWQASHWLAIAFGTLHIFILLSIMPSRQTMYWLDGLLFHALPLALFVWIVIAWFLAIQTQNQVRLKAVIFALLLFAYGGMQILTSIFGLAFWILTSIAIWYFVPPRLNKTALPVTLAAFIGLLIAFIVVITAPGNFVRLSLYENVNANVGVLTAIQISLNSTLNHWFQPFSLAHIFLTTICGIAICAVWSVWDFIPKDNAIIQAIRRRALLIIGASLILGILYTWASLFIPAMTSGRTPTRVFVTAVLVKTSVTIWIGFILGLRYAQSPFFSSTKTIVIVVAFSLLTVGGAYRIMGNVQLLPEYVQWSNEWDERHQALLQAHEDGATSVEVAPFENDLPKFLGPEPDAIRIGFARICMTQLYNIPEIRINESLESGTILNILEFR